MKNIMSDSKISLAFEKAYNKINKIYFSSKEFSDLETECISLLEQIENFDKNQTSIKSEQMIEELNVQITMFFLKVNNVN